MISYLLWYTENRCTNIQSERVAKFVLNIKYLNCTLNVVKAVVSKEHFVEKRKEENLNKYEAEKRIFFKTN